MSAKTASCQMMIHVKDIEPPKSHQCPSSFSTYIDPGQSVKKVEWKEPVFNDNVKIQHVMASYLPGHLFTEGKHNVLYTASDIDGNKAKCGFTITVIKPTTTTSTSSPIHRRKSQGSHDAGNGRKSYNKHCNKVPQVENGHMACIRIVGGKKCTPMCRTGHEFYQKFSKRHPSYLCNSNRIDWKVRRFLPDCSPVHKLGYSHKCEAGWELRKETCVACPPGMFRSQADKLCQLCPKGLYTDQFGSNICMRCPLSHTTRGLGARKSTECYYNRPVGGSRPSNLLKRRRERQRGRLGFMYYNKWMSKS